MAHIATHSERGSGNGPNQDAACVMTADTRCGEVAMAVVCDGVGGLDAGELASATVVRRFERWFMEDLPACVNDDLCKSPRFRAIEKAWMGLIAQANGDIRAYGKQQGFLLGTTCSSVFVAAGRFVAMHVGDCRILKIGVPGIEQISEDQTLLALKLRTGEIRSAREACPGDANTILQAVGAQDTVLPRIFRGTMLPEDLLAICSDGAWRKLKNDGIGRLLREGGAQDDGQLALSCQRIASRAMELGETDNITIACVSGDPAELSEGDV